MSKKQKILQTLKMSSYWLTVDDIIADMTKDGVHSLYSTTARALRKLRSEGLAVSRKLGGTRFKEWANVGASNKSPSVGFVAPNASFPPVAVKPSSLAVVDDKLTDHVEHVLTELICDGSEFTAHDVTMALRDLSNRGVLKVSTSRSVFVNGKSVPCIEHTKVRDIVHYLWETEWMDNYTRDNNGMHWTYRPSN